MINPLQLWKNQNLKPKQKIIWYCIPLAVMRTIWNQRNTCVIEKSEPNWVEVQELIEFGAAFWVPSKKGWNDYSMEDFIFRLKSMVKSL
ncbi:hypothetical protein RHGRI_004327 [Rhododendron griersonianum]|uniref:Uncharacterized protein n=2 Tax=Rhododendron griersonianum TaxID=479676 RepID=A0AAV6L920_9ERIC|nr:hypothetical protein RHGRI_004284 [Rhododendron griersonianum]KAG5561256.1 hypothetical protein RHGRI_004327 [Rhododendron griersonianum]